MALDHITFRVTDYRKEAAFYVAQMSYMTHDKRLVLADAVDQTSQPVNLARPGRENPA